MPYIKITRNTFLSAVPAKVGEVYEVSEDTAKIAVGAKCAEIVTEPGEVIETPRAKPRKVTLKAKADKDGGKTE